MWFANSTRIDYAVTLCGLFSDCMGVTMRQVVLLLGFVSVLFLAGCFRPAGDALDPTAPPAVLPSLPPPAEMALNPDSALTPTELPAVGATATLLPITIIAPGTPRPTTPTQSVGQAQSAISPTPTVLGAGVTPTFVTPGMAGGMVTIVFPTPTPPGGALTSTPSGLITPTALGGVSGDCVYVVQAGDNLFRIAVNNNVTLDEMRVANPNLVGEAPVLQVGQSLQIPNCTPSGGAAPTAVPAVPGVLTTAPAAGTTLYTIQAGDTLFSISQQFNTTIDAIIAANTLTDPNRLSVGQQINVPSGG
jgi:LysM repeat protein